MVSSEFFLWICMVMVQPNKETIFTFDGSTRFLLFLCFFPCFPLLFKFFFHGWITRNADKRRMWVGRRHRPPQPPPLAMSLRYLQCQWHLAFDVFVPYWHHLTFNVLCTILTPSGIPGRANMAQKMLKVRVMPRWHLPLRYLQSQWHLEFNVSVSYCHRLTFNVLCTILAPSAYQVVPIWRIRC